MMAGNYFRVYSAPQNRFDILRFFYSLFKNLSATSWLIIINILAFIITYVNIGWSTNYLALQANNLFNNGHVWTLFTSMFMHAGLFHLFVNMFSLYFIGTFLEMLIGKRRFVWLYVISGLFAGLFFAIFAFNLGNIWWGVRIFGGSSMPALGASGAIFGIAGVLAILTPKNKVYLIAGPLFAIILQAVLEIFVKNTLFLSMISFIVSIYVLFSIFSVLSFNPNTRKIGLPIKIPFWSLPIAAIVPLFIIGFFIVLPIGNMAHLGGFIAGAVYGLYLKFKYKRKAKIISEYFSK